MNCDLVCETPPTTLAELGLDPKHLVLLKGDGPHLYSLDPSVSIGGVLLSRAEVAHLKKLSPRTRVVLIRETLDSEWSLADESNQT